MARPGPRVAQSPGRAARVTSIPGPGPELGPEPDVTSPVSESEMKMQDGANSLADRALMASGRGRVVKW